MDMDDEQQRQYDAGRSSHAFTHLKNILKRDGDHVCWLCTLPIDMSLSKRDPRHAMAWTLDHVVPLSLDPSLALEPTNAREAHRRCNSKRGNRVGRITMHASRVW